MFFFPVLVLKCSRRICSSCGGSCFCIIINNTSVIRGGEISTSASGKRGHGRTRPGIGC